VAVEITRTKCGVSSASYRATPPWDIEDNGACFIIRDSNGQALSYVYYEKRRGPGSLPPAGAAE
jgi:hypothetical protein